MDEKKLLGAPDGYQTVLEADVIPQRPVPRMQAYGHRIDSSVNEDALIHHYQLTRMMEMWDRVETLDEMCKLSLTISALLERRRKAILLPHYADSSSTKKSGYLDALD